jgi:hypothetical protein
MTGSRTVAVLLAVCFLAACCANEGTSEHFSPNKEWKYVTFDRNCGATNGSNMQISVLRANDALPASAGNTFVGDDNHGSAPFVARALWVSPDTLKVVISIKAHVYKKEERVGAVHIQYTEE